ncbi:MAG: hypothetical protein WCC92_17645 [Candidatus Korobacteraceae bacterium]
MQELIVCFFLGGFVVSAFALFGGALKPGSFAGLFGAAPSVALATLGLPIAQHGRGYASEEARSMILGALAFAIYASLVCRLLLHHKLPVCPVTGGALMVWSGSALGLWYCLVR